MALLPTVCPLDCPDRCSMEAVVEGGRVVSLDGTRVNAFTGGTICAKVRGFSRRLHGDDRLRHPAVRVGPKGPGARFERVTWDEAIARVAGRMRTAIAQDGAEAILPCYYSGSNGMLTGGGLDLRFWRALGATHQQTTLCAANTGAAARSVYPDLPAADLGDVGHAHTVLLWGVNPSVTGIHLVPLVRAVRARGGAFAVVDPRRTPLARQADIHLPVLPGTDVVVALALVRLAFESGVADRAFLDRHAADADALAEAAAPWTPERAARIAGVDAGALRDLAALYAAGDPALLRCGWGLERNRNGTDAVRAVLSLPAVYGTFGRRGGGYCMSTSAGYRVRKAPPPGAVRSVNQCRLAHALGDLDDPPVRVLYVYNANPAATFPEQRRLLDELARDDLFTVVHEQVHTDTCDYADVLLPATTFLEHRELSRSYGLYLLQWAEPVIPPVGEARPNHAVFRALAAALDLDPSHQATEEEVAADLVDAVGAAPDGAWDTLKTERVVQLARPVQFVDVHPSGPVTFCAGGAPRYRPPPVDPELPLCLISPASQHAITSTLFELRDGAALTMHPDDAAPRGIANGDRVRAYNSFGEVVVPARVDDRVRPGVVSLPKGLWRRATANGYTATALAPSHTDDRGGGACFNDARVEVARHPSA